MSRFCLKAVLPVTVAVTGFVTVCSLLLYQWVRQDMIRSAVEQEAGLADTIIRSTRYAMLKPDRQSIENIIVNVARQRGVEHVRIFNPGGVVLFSSRAEELHLPVDRKAEGCDTCHPQNGAAPVGSMGCTRQYFNASNQPVLAVTAPIYNDSECFSASCHYHPPQEKLLGTLDIGLSRQPLDKALASLRLKMTIFAVMVLVVTSAGVVAILRRNVLMPVKALARHARRIEAGEAPEPLRTSDEELGSIARILNSASAANRNSLNKD